MNATRKVLLNFMLPALKTLAKTSIESPPVDINTHRLLSWNWAAFLGGPIWLWYHRLYFSGFLFFILSFSFNFVKYSLLFSILLYMLTGFLGNFLYHWQLDEQTNKPLKETSPFSARLAFLITFLIEGGGEFLWLTFQKLFH